MKNIVLRATLLLKMRKKNSHGIRYIELMLNEYGMLYYLLGGLLCVHIFSSV